MKNKQNLHWGLGLLAAFFLWTGLICFVDVQPIGPEGSEVGFAAINGFFHRLTGVHFGLHHITDWLGLVPFGFVMGFGLLGLWQWIKRKSIQKVDYSILVLGVFYVAVMAAYLAFEVIVINRRPVLIEGGLEASYPSSTTMLVMCVIPTAIMQLSERIRHKWIRSFVCLLLAAFAAFMVVGRLICGVHWLTDIVGGGLLSAGLVLLYRFFRKLKQ